MAKPNKQETTTATSTKAIIAGIRQIQKMSGKRARFILTALLVNEQIPLEAFRRALKMADHPEPIETAPKPTHNPFGDLIQ